LRARISTSRQAMVRNWAVERVEELKEAIKGSITDGVQMVCKYELFQHQPEFEVYMSAQENEDQVYDEQQDLISLAIGNEFLTAETDRICGHLDSVYDEMRQFSTQYERFVKMYNDNIRMDVQSFREKDAEAIKHAIQKYEEQLMQTDQIDEANTVIKIIRLIIKAMKRKVRDTPIKCLNSLREHIPLFVHENVDILYADLKVEYEKVTRKPQDID